ncbi:MAG: hypothetical protein IT340_19910 [Chloroflexi bacterium]|nr:hypothetical protein [Chloroflexota bacterium]
MLIYRECRACRSAGQTRGSACVPCLGHGYVLVVSDTTCPTCQGEGVIGTNRYGGQPAPCLTCSSTGHVVQERPITDPIPPPVPCDLIAAVLAGSASGPIPERVRGVAAGLILADQAHCRREGLPPGTGLATALAEGGALLLAIDGVYHLSPDPDQPAARIMRYHHTLVPSRRR